MVAGSPEDPERSAALFRGAAEIVAGWPDVWRGLITEHVAGRDGSCRGCPVGLRGGTRWPCGLRTLGELARTMAGGVR